MWDGWETSWALKAQDTWWTRVKLLNFCTANKLKIEGSLFRHKNIHECTWCTVLSETEWEHVWSEKSVFWQAHVGASTQLRLNTGHRVFFQIRDQTVCVCVSTVTEIWQVWLSFRLQTERVGVQVKLWQPLRTPAIPECFWGDDAQRSATSSVRIFTLTVVSLNH